MFRVLEKAASHVVSNSTSTGKKAWRSRSKRGGWLLGSGQSRRKGGELEDEKGLLLIVSRRRNGNTTRTKDRYQEEV